MYLINGFIIFGLLSTACSLVINHINDTDDFTRYNHISPHYREANTFRTFLTMLLIIVIIVGFILCCRDKAYPVFVKSPQQYQSTYVYPR
jgi:hypothetical protein